MSENPISRPVILPPSEPLRLKPAFIERPWGGSRLVASLRKATPPGLRIGESWEVSDHPSAPSGFQDAPYSDRCFGDLFRGASGPMFRLDADSAQYPLLVKFIDAGENLSIQVHPDDSRALQPGRGGKNECWYVVESRPGSRVLCGFRPGVSPDELRRAAQSGRFEDILLSHPICAGSFINVPAGTVHAILEGTLICEISQTSSEIARLWDWNRPPQPDRRLDIEQAIRISEFSAPETRPAHRRVYVIETEDRFGLIDLVRNENFEVMLLSLAPEQGDRAWDLNNPHGLVASVVRGAARWTVDGDRVRGGEFAMGETWFLPAGLNRLRLAPQAGNFRLLLSRPLKFGTALPSTAAGQP